MHLSFTKNFIKQSQKLNPKQQAQLQKRLEVFLKNPLDAQLHNHQLRGSYRQYRSINITGDVRALYLTEEDEAIFDIVGTHSQLYE